MIRYERKKNPGRSAKRVNLRTDSWKKHLYAKKWTREEKCSLEHSSLKKRNRAERIIPHRIGRKGKGEPGRNMTKSQRIQEERDHDRGKTKVTAGEELLIKGICGSGKKKTGLEKPPERQKRGRNKDLTGLWGDLEEGGS